MRLNDRRAGARPPWVAAALCLLTVTINPPPSLSAKSPEEPGMLNGIVFEAATGAPLWGVEVIAATARAATDMNGAFALSLPPGKHRLTLQLGERPEANSAAVLVVSGQATEVLAHLDENGRVRLDVEAPPMRSQTRGAAQPLRAPTRVLVGTVSNADDASPIAGARVFVRGQSVEAKTNESGSFTLSLPEGDYDITVVHTKHVTRTLTGQRLSAATLPLLVRLVPQDVRLAEVVVRTPYISGGEAAVIAERRMAGSVTEVIGAAQMKKGGDSNAASALSRVTGVTLVDGKYIYVRGLGARYASTLLNRSTLPSPEPESRVVPMDLFPTEVLESIMVQKSYTPDLPGTFAGGSVLLRTRALPQSRGLKIGLSSGYASGTTLQNGPMYPGGRFDFFGFDGGSRALPRKVRAASDGAKLTERDAISDLGYSSQQLEEFGELMPNRWSTERQRARPDLGLTLSYGDRKTAWGNSVGYQAVLAFGNEWSHSKEELTEYKSGSSEVTTRKHDYDFDKVVNTIDLTAMVGAGMQLNTDSEIRFTSVLLRLTDNEARVYGGFNSDAEKEIRVTRLRWIERMLAWHQLWGRHVLHGLGDLAIDWRYSLSTAHRNEPDRREVRYDYEGGDLWILSDRPEGNQRLFSGLGDVNHDLAFDIAKPLSLWGGVTTEFKVGAALTLKSRKVDTRRYKYRHMGAVSNDPDIIGQKPEDIFVAENIGPRAFQFEEITRATDNYTATQDIFAAYGMVDTQLGRGLRLVAGVRAERSSHNVTTFELFNPTAPPNVSADIAWDILPAANLSWTLSDETIFRVTGSRTMSRPEFRELSPATFNDVTGARQITGNEDLKHVLITTADARWEWYPNPDESVSLAIFVMNFRDPIELQLVPSAETSLKPFNNLGALNRGIELDVRKGLAFAHRRLRDAFVQSNLTVVRSEIRIDDSTKTVQTSKRRPLVGQSPLMFNLMLGYERLETGTTAVLVYNYVGGALTSLGERGVGDRKQAPFQELNLVISQALPGGLELSLKGKNLLGQNRVEIQDGLVASRKTKPTAVSVGLSYSYD